MVSLIPEGLSLNRCRDRKNLRLEAAPDPGEAFIRKNGLITRKLACRPIAGNQNENKDLILIVKTGALK
jgi:hypothetical protein